MQQPVPFRTFFPVLTVIILREHFKHPVRVLLVVYGGKTVRTHQVMQEGQRDASQFRIQGLHVFDGEIIQGVLSPRMGLP